MYLPDTMKPILTEKVLISSADTDCTRKIRVSSLTNMLIQVAWHHAENLGFGIEFMHANRVAWVLSRLQIKFDKFPLWNQELSINSWPKGIHRLFYLRDFQITDAQNRPVALATSEWLIINNETKRPKLYQPDHNIFEENANKHALEGKVPTLSTPAMEFELFGRNVEYSDVDLNQHLTTTRYIDWMLDTFDLGFIADHPCKEMVINFIREIPHPNNISIQRYHVESDRYQFEFCHPENGQVYFRGILTF